MIRLGCNRHRLEPSERGHADRAVRDEQSIQLGKLFFGHADEQRIGLRVCGPGKRTDSFTVRSVLALFN